MFIGRGKEYTIKTSVVIVVAEALSSDLGSNKEETVKTRLGKMSQQKLCTILKMGKRGISKIT